MAVVAPITVHVASAVAHVRFTTRRDGDMNVDLVEPAALATRQRAVIDHPWTMLAEVHGVAVHHVRAPGDGAGAIADGAVTGCHRAVLGIWVGDCAPVALVGDQGVIGAAHAGWRGVAAGVLGSTVDAMRALGAGRVTAVVGPCIHAGCNEFGTDDLATLARRFGDAVVARTAWDTPALDLPMMVRVALAASGVDVVDVAAPCTACDSDYWSHRARGEKQRQSMALWLEPEVAA